MSSEVSVRRSYQCQFCEEMGELSNWSRHLRIKHPEHYKSRADLHQSSLHGSGQPDSPAQVQQVRPSTTITHNAPSVTQPSDTGTMSAPAEQTPPGFVTAPFVSLLPSGSLRVKVQGINWKSYDDLAGDVDTWLESTATPPRVFPTQDCWYPSIPNYEGLFCSMIDIVEKSTPENRTYAVHDNGGNRGRLCKALYQALRKPDPSNTTYLSNLEVEIGASVLRFPKETPILTSRPKSPVETKFSPVHSFVDLQIDHGSDILATTIEDCENVWFLFPPTDVNLQVYFKHRPHQNVSHGSFLLSASDLEGGVAVQMTSDQTLHIPAGTLHAVLTTKTGFMVSQNYISIESLVAMAKYVAVEFKTPDLQVTSLETYLDCLDIALGSSTPEQLELALKSWFICVGSLRDVLNDAVSEYGIHNLDELKTRVGEIWNNPSIQVDLNVFLGQYPCCPLKMHDELEPFISHFLQYHYL